MYISIYNISTQVLEEALVSLLIKLQQPIAIGE